MKRLLLVAVAILPVVASVTSGHAAPKKDVDGSCGRDEAERAEWERMKRSGKPIDGGPSSWRSMNPEFRFREEGYLACNPDVAPLIKAGTYESAVDHYCRKGRFEHRRSSCGDGKLGADPYNIDGRRGADAR